MHGRVFYVQRYDVDWRVAYRAKDGKQTVGIFEAESRDTLLTILASKGIHPIRIEDARRAKPKNANKRLSIPRFATWGIFGLVVAAGAFLTFRIDRTQNAHQEIVRDKPESSRSSPGKATNRPKPVSEPPKRTLTAEERRAGLESVRNLECEGPALDMDAYVSPDPGFSNRWERFKAEQARLPFKYMSENEIAVVLETKPGEMILDTMPHPNFERDFLKSLEEAILPLPTDDERTARLKRDMIQAKIVLKEAYDNGESITEILREERAQLIKIHGLRENLFRELKEVEKTAKSSKEVDDFVLAANLMLDEYGAKHIKLPYSKERMRLERAEGLIP